jgi:hypothetical protein
VAALVAMLVLSVAGVAYYAWTGGFEAPGEIAVLGQEPLGIEVPEEALTVPEVVLDEPEAPVAEPEELQPDVRLADDAGIGLPAQARVVPASLDGAGPVDAAASAEEEAKEAPKEARRPVATPASEPDDPATAVLHRAASADLPLHARRDLLSGNLGTLGDARAENRVGQALQVLSEEMEFSASIIEPRNFVVGSGLVRDGNGTPNGATGVAEELRPGTVYLFARVRSPESESLTIEWRESSGRVLEREAVQVGRNLDPGYRIGVHQTLTAPGRYEVRLYNRKGTLIGLRRFEIGG